MEVHFTEHVLGKLEKHLRLLGISEGDIVATIKKPDDLVYDTFMDRYVALNYSRNLAVVYEKEDDKIIVVTAIYSSRLRSLVERRRMRGRWI